MYRQDEDVQDPVTTFPRISPLLRTHRKPRCVSGTAYHLKPHLWTSRYLLHLKARIMRLELPTCIPSIPPGQLRFALSCTSHMGLHNLSWDTNALSHLASAGAWLEPGINTASDYVLALLYHLTTDQPPVDFNWEHQAGPKYAETGFPIYHHGRETWWMPAATITCRVTGLAKGVMLEERKSRTWAEETGCILALAQMAVVAGIGEWRPIVLRVQGTTAVLATATIEEGYLQDIERCIPGGLPRECLQVEVGRWELTKVAGRIGFAEALWHALITHTVPAT
ncbi:hypothetical protein EDC01DRAFT_628381 [Geopyxis carbonaria]|nr:hypothetical protein EDC01DRAFT_628381 [Geopyxis carbonaria]